MDRRMSPGSRLKSLEFSKKNFEVKRRELRALACSLCLREREGGPPRGDGWTTRPGVSEQERRARTRVSFWRSPGHRLLGKLLTPVLILVAMIPGLLAQSSAEAGDDSLEPFRVEVEAVNVLVAVHHKKTGRFVTNLSPQHFIVKEDGRRQQLTNFAPQTNLPLTIAICVDASASVRLKLGFEKEVATDFLFDVMRPTDKALLLEFDTGVTLLHDFTSNPNALLAEIDNLRAGGGTSLYDAIYLISEQKMLQEYGRKTILVLSDGSDLTSVHTFDETLRMAYMAESTIYAISTTRFGAGEDARGDKALEKLTENTGGTVFFPHSSNNLAEAFTTIDQELRSQYNLTYVPTNKKKDGTLRKIEVEVKADDVRIRHRRGYYAPFDPMDKWNRRALEREQRRFQDEQEKQEKAKDKGKE